MRTSTSFAILALLAGASNTFAVPLQQSRDSPAVINASASQRQGKNNQIADVHAHHIGEMDDTDNQQNNKHTDGGGLVNVDAHNIGNGYAQGKSAPGTGSTGGTGRGASVGSFPPLDRIDAHSADNVHPLTGSKSGDVLRVNDTTGNQALKDDKIALMPSGRPVSGHDGVVDVHNSNLAGHVIQTPGKDKTLADVQLGMGDGKAEHKAHTKVNLPQDGPVGSSYDNKRPEDAIYQPNGVQLAGKPGKGSDVIDGYPVAQAGHEPQQNNGQSSNMKTKPKTDAKQNSKANGNGNGSGNKQPAPSSSKAPPPSESAPAKSSAPQPSSASPASAHPTSSTAPKAAQAAKASPSNHPKAAQSSSPPTTSSSSSMAKAPASSSGPQAAASSAPAKPQQKQLNAAAENHSRSAAPPAQSSSAPTALFSSTAIAPASTSDSPSAVSSQPAKPQQKQLNAAPANHSSSAAASAQSSSAPKPSSSSAPKPSNPPPKADQKTESGQSDNQKAQDSKQGYDDNTNVAPESLNATQSDDQAKGSQNASSASADMNAEQGQGNSQKAKSQETKGNGKSRPNRVDNNGQGHLVGVSNNTGRSADRKVDLGVAQVKIGKIPSHVEPCENPGHGRPDEVVNMCIEADLLAYAPAHTFKCPEEMQHGIHVHEDTGNDTMNTKLSKEVAKYIRLCVDLGAL